VRETIFRPCYSGRTLTHPFPTHAKQGRPLSSPIA
jgi:hypothetical protein